MSDTEYDFPEAFAVMTYVSDDATESEVVWNSRDGVTPFVIRLRSGKSATHKAWSLDRIEPHFVPPVGSRVFVDHTPQSWDAAHARLAERYWSDNVLDVQSVYPDVEALAAALTDPFKPGQPRLVEVTPELQASFADAAQAARS